MVSSFIKTRFTLSTLIPGVTILFSLAANLEELQNEERRETDNFKDQIEDLKAKCQEKQEIVNKVRYVSKSVY